MEEGEVCLCGNVSWATSLIKNKKGRTETHLFTPRKLVGAPKAVKVCTGSSALHCFALTAAGEAYAFGRNSCGQLGLGKVSSAVNVPTKVAVGSADDPVVDASCGKNHSLFLLKSGAVFGAGANNFGQLGNGSTAEKVSSPTKVKVPDNKKCKAIAVGLDFSLMLTEDGNVFSFGCGEFGKLGIGTDGAYNTSASSVKMSFQAFSTPRKVSNLEKVLLIAAGNHHGLAATRERVYAWGCGAYGRLGLGATKNRDCFKPEPCDCSGWIAMSKRLSDDKTMFKMIRAGKESSVAVLNDRQMTYAWGKVKATQPEADMYPKVLQDLQGWEVRSLSLGNGFILCAAEKSVIAWGAGTEGNLGLGDPPTFPKSSAQARIVDPLEGGVTLNLAAGANHSLFLLKCSEPNPALEKMLDYEPVDGPDDDTLIEDLEEPEDGRKRKGAGRGRGRGRGKRGRK